MNATHATPQTTTARRKADRAVRRLFIAVEKSIRAADEARRARDELVRLGTAKREGHQP
jgi:hypothetical protein